MKKIMLNMGGRNWGKSYLLGLEVERMLDEGKRVLIVSGDRTVLKKRKGKLTLIETRRIT